MPRQTIDQRYGNPDSRFVRYLHTDNNTRKSEKHMMQVWEYDRYMEMRFVSRDWSIIRNPRMKPLLHRGRKP